MTTTHSYKNTIAMMIEDGSFSGIDVSAAYQMFLYSKQRMIDSAPYLFSLALSYGGNPIYTDLILEHNIPEGPNKTSFESDANAYYDIDNTFFDINLIVLTTNKTPYVGCETMLSEFITFQD
tara:strand:+ start:9908 stop:10273 length:366 start_codon:yes stop_codon:yes gene_type:complete